jgi:hypothetical protein
MYNRIAVQLGYHSRQCKCANSMIKVDENCSVEFEGEDNIVNPFLIPFKTKTIHQDGYQ